MCSGSVSYRPFNLTFRFQDGEVVNLHCHISLSSKRAVTHELMEMNEMLSVYFNVRWAKIAPVRSKIRYLF